MTYFLTAPAADDINEILDYIAAQSIQNAVLVARRFEKAFEQLAALPSLGHARKELDDPAVRIYSVSGYLILYDPTLQPLHILRVVRGSRNLKQVRPKG